MSEARGIAVIIVNYKTSAMVADCLATLLPQLIEDFQPRDGE